MKKSKAETAETRRRIVDIAARAFRTQGIEATGVAEVMAAAGLTHGGFYRHFGSKEELVAEAVAASLEQLILESERWTELGAEGALQHALDYLSPESRDDVAQTCTFAAAGSELVRADEKTRHVASEAFRRNLELLAPYMSTPQGGDRTAAAISVLTNMIGALTMARMVNDPALSERILEVTRKRIAETIELSAAPKQERETAAA